VKRSSRLVASAFVLVWLVAMSSRHDAAEPAQPEHEATCGGEPCDAVLRGFRAFFDRTLDGLGANGRSCADCHMAADSFQLSPAGVEARFRLLQARRGGNPAADDPLFRPIDADDFRTNGENASDFTTLRQHGLIRIEMPLPSGIRLIDPETKLVSGETSVDVWRMVPSVNDVALTGADGANPWPRGPNRAGGYQLDARIGTLQEQALGAFRSHAQVRQAPSEGTLDDLASFQRVLFTSHRVAVLSRAIADGVSPLPDADPPLTALERQGKVIFERACANCHGGPSQATAQPPIGRYHDIATQCPRPVDVMTPARFAFAPCPPALAAKARTYEITLITGNTMKRTSSDPGRALLTGFVGGAPPTDDWNKFDVPGLRGISRTAPYFHNNTAATLEAVFDHYIEFYKRVKANAAPGVVPGVATTDGVHFDRQPTPEERQALVAYMGKL
jgi:cytochrome c peroxidase